MRVFIQNQTHVGRKTKQILAFMLSLFLVLSLIIFKTTEVFAFPGNYFWFPSPAHVRIRHPDSGLYLGIDRNGTNQNGARIQLQRYEENNQNQIFFLQPVGKDKNGRYQYKIRVHGENGMIIEIRDSSHDDYAEAAQWSDHDGDCAKWYFFTEDNWSKKKVSKVTCCIRNVESGKMLNVAGNQGYDGNNLIQYHEDNTQAEVFEVIGVEWDKTSAIWSRDWGEVDDLYWSIADDTSKNRKSHYTPINKYANNRIAYPVTYEKNGAAYLATVIWADESLQKKLLQAHNSPKSGWKKLGDKIKSFGAEEGLSQVLSGTPLGAIPTAGILGVVSTIMAGQQENQWYIIEKAIQDHSYIRIEIYYQFKSGSGWTTCQQIVNDQIDTYWDGNLSSVSDTITDYWGNNVGGTIEYLYR